VGYIKGPDGRYYTIDLDLMRTTTGGPMTQAPQMIMGANGRMYVAPTTPAMVMGANGRMYAAPKQVMGADGRMYAAPR
jgi:hypothetical protein